MNSISCTFDASMLEHQQFARVISRPSPIIRRTSTTEAVICVLVDESGRLDETLCGDPEQDTYSSFDFSFSSIKTHAQRQLEEFSESSERSGEEMRITQEAEKEARRQHVRRVEARGQRGYVYKNAMIILNDDEKFRQLKEAIKKTGMLTSGGVKQVLLSPTLDDRRARLPTAKAV
jgi:hypothetical protein